jgi:hypothetical protein
MLEQTLLAVTLKAELFPVRLSELERNKRDYLKIVVPVRPIGDAIMKA